MPVILETNRTLLRTLQAEDATFLSELWADEEVTRHMGGPRDPIRTRDAVREHVEKGEEEIFDLWPLVDRETGELLGDCGLLRKEVDGVDETEVVYVLKKEAWGKGLATEVASALRDHAFSALGLSRLIALIDRENLASQRVGIKIGMHLEKETVRPSGAVKCVFAMQAP